MRPRARQALILTLILAGLPLQPATAQQTAAEAMAHAIARMMESMGFTANVDPGGTMADSAWRAMQGASGGAMPWTGTSLD